MKSEQIEHTLNYYLVGGAVRDSLLARQVIEKDYVVVGATPEQMLALGFTQVGKDFPVFLHPKSKEEYALARTEKKQGQGYTGFICYASPEVTLAQDLLRRDLTVNAMAMDQHGNIIDPYHGQQDLNNRILRHVSPAFTEDPLRVLRVARFASRYHYLGFSIADETINLMQNISESGELATLSPERVWQEIARSLTEKNPEVFIETLRICGALKALWPELNSLWGIPNPAEHHPEICSGVHSLMVLQQAVKHSTSAEVRFAALCHDLGKSLTPTHEWPKHYGHEKSGLAVIAQVCQRLKAPKSFKQLALQVCQYHLHCHRAFELNASTIIKMFDGIDVWRKPDNFTDFLIACQADFNGRLSRENKPYPQADYLQTCYQLAKQISPQQFIAQGFKGAAIKQAITNARIEAIKEYKANI